MGISTVFAAALLLLSSEAYAAQTTINQRRRKVKIYSSSSIRRGEVSKDATDPYLGLPDEREERHLDVPVTSCMSVSIASMSMPALASSMPALASSMPALAASMPALSLSLPTTVTPTEPTLCIEIYDPVCGEDGKTYSNSCKAGVASVNVAYEGECKTAAITGAKNEKDLLAADFTNLSDETPPTSDLGLNFEATQGGPASSAKMIGQSAVVLAAAAGVVVLV